MKTLTPNILLPDSGTWLSLVKQSTLVEIRERSPFWLNVAECSASSQCPLLLYLTETAIIAELSPGALTASTRRRVYSSVRLYSSALG